MSRDLELIDGITGLLVQKKLLTAEDARALHEAFRRTAIERFEEFLLDEDVIKKGDLLATLQEYYKVPAIDATGLLLDHELVMKFPKEIMLNRGFVPYEVDGDILQVIASRPQDADLPEIMGRFVTYDVVFAVGIYRDICDAVKEFYDSSLTDMHAIDDDEDEDFENMAEEVIDEE